jgi:hypothetical protein
MTSSDVVLIADRIKFQLKHAAGQTYLNMGQSNMSSTTCILLIIIIFKECVKK